MLGMDKKLATDNFSRVLTKNLWNPHNYAPYNYASINILVPKNRWNTPL